jgi:hypothetical protein
MTSAEEYASFARAHLPAPDAEDWISSLRPAVQFPRAETEAAAEFAGAAAADEAVLRYGGLPRLPDGVAWPEFEGYGPLSFIAELDCAGLAAAGGVDLIPDSGHLLFFCVDDRYDGSGKTCDYKWAVQNPTEMDAACAAVGRS